MKVYHLIICGFVIPLTLGMLGIGITPILSMEKNIPDWTDSMSDHLTSVELQDLSTRLNILGELANRYFNQVTYDMQAFDYYSDLVFQEELSIGDYYTSYYGVTSVDPSWPPNVDADETSLETSTWFKHGVTDISNAAVDFPYLNPTSVLDNFFRERFQSNPVYQSLYIGIDSSGLFRMYPYQRMDQYPTLTYTCVTSNQMVTGYDPRCRSWYNMATDSPDKVIFTAPYVDASSGMIIISAAKAVLDTDGSTVIGVVASDLSMTDLDDSILSGTILQNGYSYIIDGSGNAVIYPDLDRSELQSILDLEFESSSESLAFQPILNRMIDGESGTDTYTKDGQVWQINYIYIESAEFSLAMTVPVSDLTAPSDDMKDDVTAIKNNGIVLLTILFVVMTVLLIHGNTKMASFIINPIRELNNVVKNITQANWDVELGNTEPMSAEVMMIYNNFRNLLNAIRFGNDAYYHGDLNRALENVLAVENMMSSLKNKRGEGICLNNKGNILRGMQGRSNEALHCYTQAIHNAKELLNSAENDQVDLRVKNGLIIILANRMINMGVFYMDSDNPTNYEKAIDLFQEARQMHRDCDNTLGIAKAAGNMGQLFMKMNRYQDAHRELVNAYDAAASEKSAEAAQYAAMNMGWYYQECNEPSNAIPWYAYALDCCPTINMDIKLGCIGGMIGMYESMGHPELADPLRDMAPKVNSGIGGGAKDVFFVLDTSGSMSGSYINQCRASINEIVDNYTTDRDFVALTTFNTQPEKVIELTPRKNNVQSIKHAVNTRTPTRGTTAFYWALHDVLHSLNDNSRTNWVIALTDGADNRSPDNMPGRVRKYLRDTKMPVNLVIITVGQLDNIQEITSFVSAIPQSMGKGMHLSVENGVAGIKEAFGQVAMAMSGQITMESL